MASLNNVKLKNIKKCKSHFKGRIDLDNHPIGYFSFDYCNDMLSNLSVDINYNANLVLSKLNQNNLFSSDDVLLDAVQKDDMNREEFNKRVDMFCKVPDKKYNLTYCMPDINDFIKKLFLLNVAENDKCQAIKKKTKSKKFNVWIGESE